MSGFGFASRPLRLRVPLARRGRGWGQGWERGFTLVEIAIAIAVIGLALGAAATMARHAEERRQFQNEKRRLEIVRDAIVGYALRNRTRARVIRYVDNLNPRAFREFHLPAGRPYLPCPDWDGDGYEDRLPSGADGFVQGMEVRLDLQVTATLDAARHSPGGVGGRNYHYWHAEEAPSRRKFWRPYGECRASRGAAPWRTLGISPLDEWGSRHTYYADPLFSNAMFGFDRQTLADIYDPRIPRASGFSPPLRHRSGARDADAYNIFQSYQRCPAVVCRGGGGGGECASAAARHQTTPTPRANVCGWNFSGPQNIILKAGAIAFEEIPSDNGRYYPAGAVTNGLPFVLVSHGPNRRFAVNHWASLASGRDGRGVLSPICNINPSLARDNPQDAFSSYAVSPRDGRAIMHEAANATRTSPDRTRCPSVLGEDGAGFVYAFNQAIFVWEPPGEGTKAILTTFFCGRPARS